MDRFMHINAMTARDLLKAVPYDTDRRSKECASNLYKFDEERGILDFVTHCSRSKNNWYQRVIVQDWDLVEEMLLDVEPGKEVIEEPKAEEKAVEEETKEEEKEEVEEGTDDSLQTEENLEEEESEEVEEKQASIKRYARDWNEVKSLVPEVLEMDIKIWCQCPAFIYWGSKFILTELDSAIELENRFPGIRDSLLDNTLCKHLSAVLRKFF